MKCAPLSQAGEDEIPQRGAGRGPAVLLRDPPQHPAGPSEEQVSFLHRPGGSNRSVVRADVAIPLPKARAAGTSHVGTFRDGKGERGASHAGRRSHVAPDSGSNEEFVPRPSQNGLEKVVRCSNEPERKVGSCHRCTRRRRSGAAVRQSGRSNFASATSGRTIEGAEGRSHGGMGPSTFEPPGEIAVRVTRSPDAFRVRAERRVAASGEKSGDRSRCERSSKARFERSGRDCSSGRRGRARSRSAASGGQPPPVTARLSTTTELERTARVSRTSSVSRTTRKWPSVRRETLTSVMVRSSRTSRA